MSTRLDHIFSYVNEIENRANKLADSVSQSHELINTISFLNQTTIEFDQTIDEINNLIDNNTSSLNEFKNLHERAFYFDSNILHNDGITNQQTFENITQEYIHLLGNLKENDKYYVYDTIKDIESNSNNLVIDQNSPNYQELYEQQQQEEEEEQDDDEEEEQPSSPIPTSSSLSQYQDHILHDEFSPPDLKKMISISNLRLKPMRCSSSSSQTIAKKKSRYRLSSIYNINPIAYDDSLVGTPTTSSTSSTIEHNTTVSSSHDYDNTRMQNSVTHSYETLDSHLLDDDHERQQQEEEVEENNLMVKNNIGSSFMPDFDHILPRGRSNSLPTSTTKDYSFSENDILKEFDCEVDILRLNRLKHFISVSHLSNKPNYGNEIHIDDYNDDDDDEQDDYDDDNDNIFLNDIYNKSPTPQSKHRNHMNDDMVSMVSDFSYYSPEKQQHHGNEIDGLFECDNFNGFLRKSRLDLNKDLQHAFPYLMKPPTPEPNYQEIPQLKYRFHNPIERQLSSSQISTATLNVLASAVMETKKLQPTTSLPFTSTSSKGSASSILHSYIERPSTPSDTGNHSFSFNDSFLKFCHSKLELTSTESKNIKISTPPRIKQLKKSKMIKSNPICIPNEAQLKRIPTQGASVRNDGSYSRLTIGTNQSKLVNHGNGSLFKNPIIRSYDQSALKEALSSSLLD